MDDMFPMHNLLLVKLFPAMDLFLLFLFYVLYTVPNKFIRGFVSLLIIAILYFYRLPTVSVSALNSVQNDMQIVSPTYGCVDKITTLDNFILISVYLSVLDVHVQYAPYSGIVINQKYKPGEFHPAHLLEKSKYNERKITVIQTKYGDIAVIQIAGMLARRIDTFVKKTDVVKKGDLLGVIHFGSRVDLLLPRHDVLLKSKVGDCLSGPNSIIAEWNF